MYLMHLWTKANVFHSNSSNSMLLWYSHLLFQWNGFRFAFRFPFIDSRFVGIILELKMQSMGVDLYFNKRCLPLCSQPFDLPPFKMCRLQTKFYVRTFLQWICWYQLTTMIIDVVRARECLCELRSLKCTVKAIKRIENVFFIVTSHHINK